jgi:hypothetical protein
MKICTSTRLRLAGGSGMMDHVMTVVLIAGIALTVVVLKKFTPLPFWACYLVGFPLFIGVFLGTVYLLSRRGR